MGVKEAEESLNPSEPSTDAVTEFGSLLSERYTTPTAPVAEVETEEEEVKDEAESETEEVEEAEEADETTQSTEAAPVDSPETESRAGVADEVEEEEPRLPKRLLEAAKKDDVLAARIARAMLGLEGSETDVAEEEEPKAEVQKKFKALIAEGKDFEALELVTSLTEKRIRREMEKREVEAKREQSKQRDRTLRFIEFTQKRPDWKNYEKAMVAEYKRLAAAGLGKAAFEHVSPEDVYLLAKARSQGGPGPRVAAAAKAAEQAKKEGAAATAAPTGAKPAGAPAKKKASDAEQDLMRKQFEFMRRRRSSLLQ